MPYDRVSAYGISRGNVSDAEKMAAQQRQYDIQAQAAMAELAARERMHGKSDATQRYGVDQQTAVAGKFSDRAEHDVGMFGMKADHDLTMADKDTARQMGVTGLQMGPANKTADLATQKYNDSAGVDNYVNQMVLNRLKAMDTPAAPQAPANPLAAYGQSVPDGKIDSAPAAKPGLSDQDIQMFSVLAALKGGSELPDFQTQAAQRRVTQMQLEDLERNRAKGRAEEQLAGGQGEMAKQTAANAGVVLPQMSVDDAISAKPSFTLGMNQAADGLASGAGGFDAEGVVAKMKPQVDAMVAQLVGQNVDPAEARARVAQILEERLPKAGFASHPISTIIDMLLPGSPLSDLSTETQIRQGMGLSSYGLK